MNQTHYTHKDSNDMAATAAYHDQMAGANMAMGMGQHLGGQNSNIYGDSSFYQLDQATFDSQNPPPIDPNQTPLLNNGESQFIANFFDDPEHINPFEYTARPDEKPALNGDHLYAGAAFDPRTGTIQDSGSAGQAQPSFRKSHVGSTPTYAGGQQAALSADDYRAAHTIGNLKEDFSLTPNQPNFAGSWGNFMMPNLNAGLDMPGFSGAFSQHNSHMQAASQARPSSINVSRPQAGGQVPNVQQKHFYAQPQAAAPPQQPSRNQSFDSASQHVRHQQQPQQTGLQGSRSTPTGLAHGQPRPPLPQWGSDPHFGGGSGFAAPATSNHHHNKDGNLLGIFGAQEAKTAQMQNGNRKSTGRGNSMTSPIAAWGSMAMPSSSFNRDDQSRKRRKSHVEREDEDDSRPLKTEDSDDEGFAGGSAKRRKSVFNGGAQASNSPGADDDDVDDGAGNFGKKRGSKKSRETLSEAQKRDNHIKSEKKRREIINTGYNDLNRLVPLLAAGKSGLSRSECLQEVASFLRSLNNGSSAAMSQLGTSNADWDKYRNSPEGQNLLNSYS